MPDKLNQSLDQILSERRKNNRRSRGGRRPTAGAKPAPAPPVGGVKKATKNEKKPEKAAVPTGPARVGESKIIVSNLPLDVTETQIKDYFNQSVGAVKKVLLSYGPNGKSRGIATLSFAQAASATKAAKELDGLKVDNRPMKIELILGAKDAPEPPAAKSLSERVAPKPAAKDKPKPATATKAAPATKGGKKPRGRGGRNAGRGKPKTAEELDAEMADYFDATAANGAGDATITNGGAVQPAANGDVGMDDDVIA